MIVVDASAMIEMLVQTESGGRGQGMLRQLTASRHAPHLLDVEVAQVLRRYVRKRVLTSDRAEQAIADLAAFPIRRHGHTGLLDRVFALRANLTAYDAVYVALAEALGATLLTCDSALAGVPGLRAPVVVV